MQKVYKNFKAVAENFKKIELKQRKYKKKNEIRIKMITKQL